MWVEYELALEHQRDLRAEAARARTAAAVPSPRRPRAWRLRGPAR